MSSINKTLQIIRGTIVRIDGINVLSPVAVVSEITVYPIHVSY